jgi:hypothetical protein
MGHEGVLFSVAGGGVKYCEAGARRVAYISGFTTYIVQGDSKRWTQLRTSIFPEIYTVYE